eukprot:TRINITY_DN3332_c0_g1_i1.p1 TRINITY_DN3332_c0_g1~~TRINITY_DN3332_c0_g1_i1.p1  ORF type:complete len:513 (+),score=88.90 TRINITY_DN3332_c0_g1_i1:91-1539(+)
MSFDLLSREQEDAMAYDAGRDRANSYNPAGYALSKKDAQWVKDKDAKECAGCGTSFKNNLKRKHHCRSCGQVFCDPCTQNKEYLMKEKGKRDGKHARVCLQCANSAAIDREEPLFKLLGPELGQRYYYKLKKAKFGDLQELSTKSKEELEEIMTSVGVAVNHKPEIIRKLQDCHQMSSGSLRMNLEAGRSPTSRLVMATSPMGDGAFLTESPSLRSDSPGILGRTRPGSIMGTDLVGVTSNDVKQLKKKHQEDLIAMSNEKQKAIQQLHVLEASMAAQKQSLTRAKALTEEEEKKIGRLQELEDEVAQLRTADRIRNKEKDHISDLIAQGKADSDKELKDRKKAFMKGKHKMLSCMLCLSAFTFFSREHHCRQCYRSCCDSCSRTRSRKSKERQCDWCAALDILATESIAREIKESRTFRLSLLSSLQKSTNSIRKYLPNPSSHASITLGSNDEAASKNGPPPRSVLDFPVTGSGILTVDDF